MDDNNKGTGEYIYIYEILESHTIIEWLSRMNVKDEYCGAKTSEENLEKDSPYVLLVFAWNKIPHRVRSKEVVQLVDMEKGLVGFPTIT